jgi:outer membrane protein OmpA-like peptidoglycan-associated protein
MTTWKLPTLTTLALAATLAACSSTPAHNPALESARSQLGAAQNNPDVGRLAAPELARAVEALRTADRASVASEPLAAVDHLAYLTTQRVRIAQDTASARSAQETLASAGAERDRLVLAMRTAEADSAQRALLASTAQTEEARRALQRRSAETDAARRDLATAQDAAARKSAELAAADAAAAQARERERERQLRQDQQVGELEAQLRELNARKTERGMVVTLGDVLFDTGRADLHARSTLDMGRLAEVFKRNPSRQALIEGHTDSIGSADSNVVLSQRRATAVMSALVGLGVQPNQLRTEARGQDSPTASNDTAAGRQMNRRVEIIFAP